MSIPQGWTVISMMRGAEMHFFINKDSGKLTFRNRCGHYYSITNHQWEDMLIQAKMCRCGECFVCTIAVLTSELIYD